MLTSTDLGQPTARHIIIVAASTPSDDTEGMDIGNVARNETSVWQRLAHKLMQVQLDHSRFFQRTQTFITGRYTMSHDSEF